MARWEPRPSDPIGAKEPIGRRFFERQQLKGARDQPRPSNFYELSHFEEKRSPVVSMDRLGKTSIEPKVRDFLIPRCQASAATFTPRKVFVGWATAKAEQFANFKGQTVVLVADPMNETDGNALTQNPYHIHASRPSAIVDSYLMALHLREIFHRQVSFLDVGADLRPPWRIWLDAMLGKLRLRRAKKERELVDEHTTG